MNTAKHYSTKDRRGLVWINEIGVLRALAHYDNVPMYVSAISKMSPEIHELHGLKQKKFTKPGVSAACLRLKRRGVLDETFLKTPKKARKTVHYSIMANLGVFSSIYSDYGLGILDDIRGTRFGQNTIYSGLKSWLPKKLGFDKDLLGVAPAEDLQEIYELACISTSALAILVSGDVPFNQYEEKKPTEKVQLRVGHLHTVMHFASAFDLAKRSPAQLAAENLRFVMRLESEIAIGSRKLKQVSDYNSEEVAGRQRSLLERHREMVNAPDT